MLSGSSYDVLSHVLVLPIDCTLRDYTHFVKGGIGVQVDVTKQLRLETNIDELEDWQKICGISI